MPSPLGRPGPEPGRGVASRWVDDLVRHACGVASRQVDDLVRHACGAASRGADDRVRLAGRPSHAAARR